MTSISTPSATAPSAEDVLAGLKPPSRFQGLLPRLLFLAALVVHITFLVIDSYPEARGLVGDERQYSDAAKRLVAGERLEPSILWPPLYARFLALIEGVFGPTLARPALGIIQILLLAFTALFLARIHRRLGGSARGAWVVAGMVLAFPPLAAYAQYLWPEVLHLALFALAVWIVLSRPLSTAWALLLGGVLGLAILAKSLLLPFLPAFALGLWRVEDAWFRKALRMALVGVALVVTILPTLVLQRHATGVWGLGQSGAFNLWVGLNDRSTQNRTDSVVYREYLTYIESAETWPERQAILKTKIRTYFAEHSFVEILRTQASRQYFRLFHRDSFLIDMLPGGHLTRDARGYVGLSSGLSAVIRWTSYLAYAALLLAASWGFWLYAPRGRGAWLLLAFVLYNLALFFWLHVKTRYRVPLLPCVFLYATCGIEGLWGDRDRAEGSWRVVMAVLTGVVLLFFAGMLG